MIFRDTLLSILLFVNEKYCLCTCFAEFIFNYWLLVVPLAIFIPAPVVSSRTDKHRMQETQNAARKYHSLLKDNT